MREFIFNEASLEPNKASEQETINQLVDMTRGIVTLVERGVARTVFRTTKALYEIMATSTSNLAMITELACRDTATRDAALYFREISAKYPLHDGLQSSLMDRFLLSDTTGRSGLEANRAGLVLSALSNGIAVSLCTDNEWDRDRIELSVSHLTVEGEAVETLSTDHLSRIAHAEPIRLRWTESQINLVKSQDFWDRCHVLFPNLSFGLDVKAQINRIGEDVFRSALSRLHEIDRASAEWVARNHPRPKYYSNVTPETSSTMKKFGRHRQFRSSHGETQTFEMHARLCDGHRLHLREVVDERRIEIGYIGRHLPTATFQA